MRMTLAAALAASALVFAPSASAADFFPGDPEFGVSGDPFNGPVSGSLGLSGLPAGVFTDNFFFRIGTVGLGSGSIITTTAGAIGSSTDLDFMSVIFNNGFDDYIVSITGGGSAIEMAAINNIPIFAGVWNTLTVTYTSRGNGSYGGQLTFEPGGVVPEPATWALMMLGMAGVGFAMRRRKNEQVRVKYAF